MADKLNTPKKGVVDWHIPVNENFTTLEDLLYDSQTGEPFGDTATESIQDIIAALVVGNDNVNISYDDTNDTLTVSLADSASVNSLEATDSLTDPEGTVLSSNSGIRSEIAARIMLGL